MDLDVLAKSLDNILIAMGTDDSIQMCSVESYGEDTPYGNDLEITLEKQRIHFKRIWYLCNPVIQHEDVRMMTMPYSHMPLSTDDLFRQSL